MKSVWSHSLHMNLCAAAVCALLGAAHAQSTPPTATSAGTASGTVTSPEPAAQTAAPAPASPQVQPQSDKKPAHMQRKSSSRKGDRHHGQRGTYATPQAHEAAAARADERAGRLSRGATADQYQRNALARCDVFRETADRDSCIQRVRSGEVSGSVQEGGVLRELTEQVPVQP